MNPSWTGSGFSHHSVPSLSNVAIRSATGTKSGPPAVVTRSTKSRIAARAGVSFQDASGSSGTAGSYAARYSSAARWRSSASRIRSSPHSNSVVVVVAGLLQLRRHLEEVGVLVHRRHLRALGVDLLGGLLGVSKPRPFSWSAKP